MASIFRRRKTTYTLKQFYESDVTLPVIIYIEQGFSGNNAVETIGAGQYFFIHAVYRQRRVMTRGHIPSVSADKCLISIPVSYPIRFRRVESRLQVGHEEFMWSLLKKFDPPFQVQMSRTERRRLVAGPHCTTTSEISNLLVMGKYKEIYLLGNLLNQESGALYYKQVTAIPLYLPDIEISVVDGFAKGIDGRWMNYIDELYAFALQEIDLHGSHGNKDISIFIEDNSTMAKSQMCEYLVPDDHLLLQSSEQRNAPREPSEPTYQPLLRTDNSRYSLDPTVGGAKNRKKQTDTVEPPPERSDGDDEVSIAFSRDYTPLDEIRDLKRPVPAPRQRQPCYSNTPPEVVSPPLLPPRNRKASNDESKDIETLKDTSPENVQLDGAEGGEDTEKKEGKSRTAMPFYDKEMIDIQKKLSEEFMKMCEKRKESDMMPQSIPEPEADYDMLPPKREQNSEIIYNRREHRQETNNSKNDGQYQSSTRYVTVTEPDDIQEGPTQKTFDPTMPFDNMTIKDIVELLKMLNLHKYEAVFRDNQVDGFMLRCLTDNQLRDCFGFTVLESTRLMNFILHRHLPNV